MIQSNEKQNKNTEILLLECKYNNLILKKITILILIIKL